MNIARAGGRSHRTRSGHFRRTAISAAIVALFAGPQGIQAAQPGQTLSAGTLPQLRALVSGNAIVNAPIPIPNGQKLVIDQSSQKAILDWNSFNIARGSEVRFNQPGAAASVLNRIYDADPTIIQGKLSANGQIYLINQNGILFDRGSQVNVYSLVASTLDLDYNLYQAGILSNASTVPDFIRAAGNTGSIEIGVHGNINEVARIETAAGGSIIVLAPTIVNNGVLKSPDGQVILAAGNKAFLYTNPNPNDFTMRGLFVEVEADGSSINLTKALSGAIPGRAPGDVSAKSGDVFNIGEIHSDRGNTTLAGLAVNQAGRISAQTAVNQNGSIWLVAKGGQVVTTAGSRTETPVSTDTSTTLKEDQDFSTYRPVVRVEANKILHRGSIVSPNGIVSLTASGSNSRVLLDTGSSIDVAGTWADVSLDKNFATFTVTSNDLKDAPEQKDGFLKGKKVTVDLRTNPALFDLGGKRGSVGRTAAEKTAAGGDIAIAAGDGNQPGDIILRRGAVLDVTGGGYRYGGGVVTTPPP
jgi:filamentous hemagglutinin family protein